MAEYMITLRAADGKAGGQPRYLTFDDPAGADTELDPNLWMAKIIAGFPADAGNPAGHPMRTGDILFLCHGFNVDHDAAKAFHIKVVNGLAAAGWHGQVVSYDWPSDGEVFAYLPDRANARAAASNLIIGGIKLLEAAQRNHCTLNVHIMAHSMGCFVTQQAFLWAYQDVPSGWKVGQILFVAADVDASVFSPANQTAIALGKHSGRFTAYINRYDKALLVSNAKRIDLAPRLGRIGLPADTTAMYEVDCSDLFDKTHPDIGAVLSPTETHSFYFSRPEFWQDAVLTLGGGIDGTLIPGRKPDPARPIPDRYTIAPGGLSDADYQKALARAASTPSVKLDS